jgi:hypothetical protein
VQDDLGGAENVQRMFGSIFGGEDASPSPEDREIPPDDRPSKPRPEPDRPASLRPARRNDASTSSPVGSCRPRQ